MPARVPGGERSAVTRYQYDIRALADFRHLAETLNTAGAEGWRYAATIADPMGRALVILEREVAEDDTGASQ